VAQRRHGAGRIVTDLAPNGSAFPRGLLAVGNVLVFTADDGTTGEELWRTDGTARGTGRLFDLDPTGGSTPRDLRALGGRLIFSASDDGTGRHLFAATDCLADDPERPCRVERLPLPAMPRLDRGLPFQVRDIRPGAAGSSPYALTAVGRTLFFRATDDTAGTELWKSDGTDFGTELVHDVRPGRDSSRPYELTNVQGTLFFQADDGTHGTELWATDGTAAGRGSSTTPTRADGARGPRRSRPPATGSSSGPTTARTAPSCGPPTARLAARVWCSTSTPRARASRPI
jgi:ELWxxDGT repeat protein